MTVRTLHHYDRIGLLKPSDYTGVGFRLYRDGDFVRLQQIVTLKFIGFSLKEIKRLLERKGSGLSAALRAQRMTLEKSGAIWMRRFRPSPKPKASLRPGPNRTGRRFKK